MADSFPSPKDLKGAVKGTLIYLTLYFVLITFQSFSKFYLLKRKRQERASKGESKEKISLRTVKYYNSEDFLALLGDRTVGNFLEYAFVFLSVLWIHALFVNPSQSFALAMLYTFFRGIYPIMFSLGVPYIFFSTWPAYFVLWYMMEEIARKFVFE